MSVRRRVHLALVSFADGSVLLVAFEPLLVRGAGVAVLVAAVVLGACAILTHENLDRDIE